MAIRNRNDYLIARCSGLERTLLTDISRKSSGSGNRLPIDAGGTLRALQLGLAGVSAAGPLAVVLAANAVPVVLMGAMPVVLGAAGAWIGYLAGRNEK